MPINAYIFYRFGVNLVYKIEKSIANWCKYILLHLLAKRWRITDTLSVFFYAKI